MTIPSRSAVKSIILNLFTECEAENMSNDEYAERLVNAFYDPFSAWYKNEYLTHIHSNGNNGAPTGPPQQDNHRTNIYIEYVGNSDELGGLKPLFLYLTFCFYLFYWQDHHRKKPFCQRRKNGKPPKNKEPTANHQVENITPNHRFFQFFLLFFSIISMNCEIVSELLLTREVNYNILGLQS